MGGGGFYKRSGKGALQISLHAPTILCQAVCTCVTRGNPLTILPTVTSLWSQEANCAPLRQGMGVASRGINCGKCSHSGCWCGEFLKSSSSSKCHLCNDRPTSRKSLDSPQQPGFGSDNPTTKPVAPYAQTVIALWQLRLAVA